MTIKFEYVNTDVSNSLSTHAEKKLNKLANKYEFLIGAQVYIKHDSKDHDAGKICNIELSLPGPRIFATSNERTYEMAVNETVNDLERQLKKRKSSFNAH